MTIPIEELRRAQEIIAGAARIVCICHRNPDGDAIGSLLGMALLIENACPGKTVLFQCTDPAPETCRFLPGALRIRHDYAYIPGDAAIILDCGEPKLTEMHETHSMLFDGSMPTIEFDHHHRNPLFASVNFVFPEAASTCEIIVAFADAVGWKITSDIATCLLTGVYTDTGGLLHSNTTAAVYRTVARLLRAGARRQEIVTAVFRTAKFSTLKLWGRVLEKISLTAEGGAISAVTEGDFRASGADYSELTGAIDYVNAVPGMRFSLILSERGGTVKGSLRTLRDDVDVSAMAAKFSGGGHKKAAGFALPGKLKPEIRWKVEQSEEEQGKTALR
ncbi:MAG: phosphoesterase RecJ domain-containing protein [Candidatus Peregrinibacteria bacterium Greene1014_49]|nr:MAG: phosphoesterase RecJ domain-containing protein [Candidatus Peregrinibacteria bacterium Greene1014_49]